MSSLSKANQDVKSMLLAGTIGSKSTVERDRSSGLVLDKPPACSACRPRSLSSTRRRRLGIFLTPSSRRLRGRRWSCPTSDSWEGRSPCGGATEGDSEEAGPEAWNYPSLYDDAARYMECLDEFQRSSDEWEGVRGWIEDQLAKLVESQDLSHQHGGLVQASQLVSCDGSLPVGLPGLDRGPYMMLGVGSGSGEVDFAILRVLLNRHPYVSTVVIEPDLSQINLYRLLMEDCQFAGATFSFHQKTSSEFIMENILSNVTYDLIHMVHVLYHIEMVDLETTLSHFYNSLNPGGIMFIAYESDKSSIARIRGALQPFKPGMPPYMSITDIENTLAKIVPLYQRDDVTGSLDVTACLQEDHSARAECLWDFITRAVNFRANAPEEAVQKVADMLRKLSWQDGNGKMMTNTDTAVLIVKKGNYSQTTN